MLKARFFLPVLMAAAILSGCSSADRSSSTIDSDATQRYEQELQPNFDLSTVLVARFTLDGQELEAISLFPLSLPSTTTPATGKARTWVWFDAERTVLRLMSKPNDGKTSFLEVPVAELKAGLTLSIPVVQADGSLKDGHIMITEILKKP